MRPPNRRTGAQRPSMRPAAARRGPRTDHTRAQAPKPQLGRASGTGGFAGDTPAAGNAADVSPSGGDGGRECASLPPSGSRPLGPAGDDSLGIDTIAPSPAALLAAEMGLDCPGRGTLLRSPRLAS